MSGRVTEILARIFLGRRLANRETAARKIGAFEGVPAMGLDGLASSAYGPEAMLAVLAAAGAAGSRAVTSITFAILILLGILYLSYRQTIQAYPRNSGAYLVVKQNLGPQAGLFAASALMVDYVLNVAVGISAGVAALVSAIPSLHPHMLRLCLGILLLIAVVNLRGTVDAGRLFALPTYLFITCFVLILGMGAVKSAGLPAPPGATPSAALDTAGVWLALRAFASGCTAMTGIEAVSNGVNEFREPVVKHAHRTLSLIVAVLALLLMGIAHLARTYAVTAMDQTQSGYQSVLSQIASAVVGRGTLYHVALGSALCVLALSANTSFVAFPRLCRAVAQDGFLPQPFAAVGRRLVFSVGILYLTFTAGLLLIVFGGITDRLIPLFAIGAVLTFTLSQAGMVMHWRSKLRTVRNSAERFRHRMHLGINACGAIATTIALLIILIAKFNEGAWITVLVIPGMVLLLRAIGHYYRTVSAQLRDAGPIDLRKNEPLLVLVPTENWNRLTDKAISLALRLAPQVIAVHFMHPSLENIPEQEQKLRELWASDVKRPAQSAGFEPPQLLLLETPYRRMHAPLLKLIDELQRAHPRRPIAVLIPELVKAHWWQYLLHSHRARRLRSRLLRHGGPQVLVIDMPWYLERPRLSEALEKEELLERD